MTTTSSTTSTTSTATAASTAASTSASNTSLGNSILTSLNANGSGIDTDALTTKLTAAQKSAAEDGITAKQATNAAQITASATIANAISSFSTSLNTLVSGGTLMTQPVSSDTGVATATAISGAHVGNLSASVTVTSLATAQSLNQAVTGFPTTNAGTMTITVGSTATPITVPAGTTAAGLVSLINAQKLGVTATTVTSGGTTNLVLKGTTGAANAFAVSGNGDPALSDLSYTPASTTTNSDGTVTSTPASGTMTANTTAADAVLTVDGVRITRASNTVNDAITGVSLTLVKPGTISLGATRPADAITTALQNFVDLYNALQTEIASDTVAATNTTPAGPLRGNATIRDVQSQLKRLTTTPLTAGGSVTTLAQLGFKTATDGTLSIEQDKLAKVLAAYPDDVEAMFNPAQTASDPAIRITSAVGTIPAGTYQLTNVTSASANGGTATGTLDGTPMSALAGILKPAKGTPADGLILYLSSGVKSSSTLTVDLGITGAMSRLSTALVGTGGTLANYQAGLATQTKTLAAQLTAADAAVTVYHDRLVSQFSTMNTRVSAYKATQSYITQQVDLWTKSTG